MGDWNWFFSSLAQSAAALVGLFGAFIVARVLSNEATYSQKKSRLAELLARSERLVDDVESRYFEWYNDGMTEEATHEIRALWNESDGLTMSPEQLYEEVAFSMFIPKHQAIEIIENVVAALHAERKAKEAKKSTSQMYGVFGSQDYDILVPHQIRSTWRDRLDAERTAIGETERDIRQNQREIRELFDAVVAGPQPSRHINYALVATGLLFYVGVIYPLSFLPAADAPVLTLGAFVTILFSLKGVLLAATSLIFTVLLMLFVWVNSRIRFDQADLDELKRYLDVGAYSSYLRVKAENEAIAREHDDSRASKNV